MTHMHEMITALKGNKIFCVLCHVVYWLYAIILEEHAASIISAEVRIG